MNQYGSNFPCTFIVDGNTYSFNPKEGMISIEVTYRMNQYGSNFPYTFIVDGNTHSFNPKEDTGFKG